MNGVLATRDTLGCPSTGRSFGGPLREINVVGVVLNRMRGGAVPRFVAWIVSRRAVSRVLVR